MGKATAAFVHAGDVEGSVARHVTGDLHVADEGRLGAHHDCAAPGKTIVSGARNEVVRVGLPKVVPGNIHIPKEGRTGVIVGPARLAAAAAVVVNAEMGPAIGVMRSGGLIPAECAGA